ncbi:16S rRNA (uracil(1498)-N(3))-methyltransferase [Thermodesulfobacteriota bacterium]
MRYFYIEELLQTGSVKRMTGPDVKHIRNVLRCKPGDHLMVLNGEGFEYEADIVEITSTHVDVAIGNKKPSTAESPVDITIAQAFLKERKMDALVRPLTELGIKRWVPFFSERSVPKPDGKRLVLRTERWRKIARESLKQCKRGRLPEISDTGSYGDMLQLCRHHDIKLILWENESVPLQHVLPQTQPNNVTDICVVLGPEGGFTEKEIKKAEAYGFASAGLGPRIMRAETAAIAAGALIQYLFGDLGQKRA